MLPPINIYKPNKYHKLLQKKKSFAVVLRRFLIRTKNFCYDTSKQMKMKFISSMRPNVKRQCKGNNRLFQYYQENNQALPPEAEDTRCFQTSAINTK